MNSQRPLLRAIDVFIGFIALRNLFQRRRKINRGTRHAAISIKTLCLLLGGLLLLGCSGDPILGLTALYLSPQSAFVTVQGTVTFSAYGIINNDASNPQEESLNVTWNQIGSSNIAGMIPNISGGGDNVAIGYNPGGPVSVSATGNIGVLDHNGFLQHGGSNITAYALLTVSKSPLVSITIDPINPSISLGGSEQFTATGTFADGSTADVTNSVAWTSSDTTVATISTAGPDGSPDGLAIGGGLAITASGATADQFTTITAATSVSGVQVSASTVLTISGGALTAINVSPATSTLTVGSTQQYVALGTFTSASGATTAVLPASELTWSSSNTHVASIISGGNCTATQNTGNSCGLATAIGIGGPISINASVTLSGQTITGNAQLSSTIGATLLSIDIDPIAQSVAPGTTQQYTAQGIFSDGSTHDVTGAVNWTSSNTAAASINAQGLAAVPAGAAAGSDTIIAASTQVSGQTVSAIAILTVASKALVSISVTPATASVAVSGTQQYTVTGTYSDNSTQDLTGSAAWTSSDPSVATIVSGNGCTATPNTSNSCGFATGVATGSPVTITASVTASGQSFTGTASLTVSGSSQLACNPPPNPSGGGAQPYDNESYCASFSGSTDQGYTFNGTLTFTTPTMPGAIINCEFASSGTVNKVPASTGPTPCTGGTDPYGNLTVTDASGNTFTGTFSSDGSTVSGTYSFSNFGPGGGVVFGTFSGTKQ